MQTTPNAPTQNPSYKTYKALLQTYLFPERAKVIRLGIFILTAVGLQLLTPQIIREFIDNVIDGVALSTLITLAALYIVVALSRRIITALSIYFTEDIKWRATNRLRGDLIRHCLQLGMNFHNRYSPGQMIERIDGDVTGISNFLSKFIIEILANILLLVGIFIVLFLEDWRIGLALLIFSILTSFVLSRTVSWGVPTWKDEREASSQLYGFIEERLAGTEDIQTNGATNYVMNGLYGVMRLLFLKTRRRLLVTTLPWATVIWMFVLSEGVAFALGIHLFLQDTITIGTVYLILQYNALIQGPLEGFSRQLQDLQGASANIIRVQELFNLSAADPVLELSKIEEQAQSNRFKPLPAGALSIQFKNVSFSYQNQDQAKLSDRNVLENVSFTLESGEVLGLLGRTGSGKTTLTRLLSRLYEPTSGQIYLGGRNILDDDVNLMHLRQKVGMVTQDVQLFQAKVRDNLTFFEETINNEVHISDEKILGIFEEIGLSEWYSALPDGLDTVLTSGSMNLSAGQAQLVAFVRVFLRNPDLIILDEASSRLDLITEQLMERAIDKLLADRTAIIIAHRLKTVERANKIMILQDGHILEYGERKALLEDPNSHFSHLLRVGLEEILA